LGKSSVRRKARGEAKSFRPKLDERNIPVCLVGHKDSHATHNAPQAARLGAAHIHKCTGRVTCRIAVNTTKRAAAAGATTINDFEVFGLIVDFDPHAATKGANLPFYGDCSMPGRSASRQHEGGAAKYKRQAALLPH